MVGRPKPTCRGGSSHLWVIGADRASRTTPPTSHPPTEVSNSKPLLLSMIKPLVTGTIVGVALVAAVNVELAAACVGTCVIAFS